MKKILLTLTIIFLASCVLIASEDKGIVTSNGPTITRIRNDIISNYQQLINFKATEFDKRYSLLNEKYKSLKNNFQNYQYGKIKSKLSEVHTNINNFKEIPVEKPNEIATIIKTIEQNFLDLEKYLYVVKSEKNNFKYIIDKDRGAIIREDQNGMKVIVHKGSSVPNNIVVFKNAVIVAFNNNKVYKSPDGLNLGGGGRTVFAYKGNQKVVSMIVFKNNVVTAFSKGGVYKSSTGLRLGSGKIKSFSDKIKKIEASNYKGRVGILVTFQDKTIDPYLISEDVFTAN